jgi:hypothetical protein
VLKVIRQKLGRARRVAVCTAALGLVGSYLQVLAYVWGTAVLLSGLVALIDDVDYWVVTGLVLVGSVVLLAVRATNQVHQGWFAGYYRDGFSGYERVTTHHCCCCCCCSACSLTCTERLLASSRVLLLLLFALFSMQDDCIFDARSTTTTAKPTGRSLSARLTRLHDICKKQITHPSSEGDVHANYLNLMKVPLVRLAR